MGMSHRRLSALGATLGVLLLAAAVLGSSGNAANRANAIATSSAASSKTLGSTRSGSMRPGASTVVLYDQYNNPAATSPQDITSQDFETVNDAYDSYSADDFSIPAGQTWNVEGIDVDGEYNTTGPAAAFHVHFYSNAAGNLPGPLVFDRPSQAFTGAGGDASIALSSPVALTAGIYWVSVQARQDFATAGQWFWHNRTIASNAPATWQNPGGGFGSTCVTWNTKATCIPGQTFPDQVFRLNGTMPPPPPPPPPPVRCRVPRVVGQTLARAKRKIRNAHCRVGRIRRVQRGRPGRVLAQSPRPGAVKPRNFPVRLVVGR